MYGTVVILITKDKFKINVKWIKNFKLLYFCELLRGRPGRFLAILDGGRVLETPATRCLAFVFRDRFFVLFGSTVVMELFFRREDLRRVVVAAVVEVWGWAAESESSVEICFAWELCILR